MKNETHEAAIQGAAEEIGKHGWPIDSVDQVAAIIRTHLPAPVGGVDGKLLGAAKNAWTALNLRANASDYVVKCRRELMEAITTAESQPASLESELAEALEWALTKEPSPCRCMSFAAPPHVCVAHKALARHYAAKKGTAP